MSKRNTQLRQAFTPAGGRFTWQTESGGQIRSYTQETAKDEQQSLQIPRPLRERTNLLANECELRNSGEGSDKSDKTEVTPHQARLNSRCSSSLAILSPEGEEIHDTPRHKAAKPASCKSIVPQCPVLDLLHARRVSPIVLAHKSAQSARYPDSLCSVRPQIR